MTRTINKHKSRFGNKLINLEQFYHQFQLLCRDSQPRSMRSTILNCLKPSLPHVSFRPKSAWYVFVTLCLVDPLTPELLFQCWQLLNHFRININLLSLSRKKAVLWCGMSKWWKPHKSFLLPIYSDTRKTWCHKILAQTAIINFYFTHFCESKTDTRRVITTSDSLKLRVEWPRLLYIEPKDRLRNWCNEAKILNSEAKTRIYVFT